MPLALLKTIAALKLYNYNFLGQKVSSKESVNRGKAHENSWYKKTQSNSSFTSGYFNANT